jgi:hypothetical protein
MGNPERFDKAATRATVAAWQALKGPNDWRHRVITCDVGVNPTTAARVELDPDNMMAVFAYSRLNLRTGETLWTAALHEVIHVLGHELVTLASHLESRYGPHHADVQALNVGTERVTIRLTRVLAALIPCPAFLAGQTYTTPGEPVPYEAA